MQEVTTQTEFIIPTSQMPTTSLLQKRTFSSCFVPAEKQNCGNTQTFKSQKRMNMIIQNSQKVQLMDSTESKSPYFASGSTVNKNQSMKICDPNVTDSMFQNSGHTSFVEQ